MGGRAADIALRASTVTSREGDTMLIYCVCGYAVLMCNQPLRPTQPAAFIVPAKEQWQCFAAGKVTVGFELHWPCVTDSVCGISTTGSMA